MKTLLNFIHCDWTSSSSSTTIKVHNPSSGETIALTPLSPAEDVDAAVQAATAAFPAWRDASVTKKTTIFFRYKELLERHAEELADIITRENGKTHAEAQGDVRRGIEVVEFACGLGQLLKGENLPQISTGIDGSSTREALGVCAGITPFNFPAMVPMWMFPLAIACGNTFILKPSEKVPLTAIRLTELFTEAGLPPGVLNLVHGGREVVEALCTHPGIAAVSFVGSSAIAEKVYQLATQHGKRVQAAGGAKNVLVVMPDADPDSTLRAILGASYGCAGQRCMAGSMVFGVGEAADAVRERLSKSIDAMKLLPTDVHRESDMGPVIDGGARDRLFEELARIPGEGLDLVRDGRKGLPEKGFFVGPSLVDGVLPGSRFALTELFGPILGLARPGDLDEALAWICQSGYGNGAVIFTRSGSAARHFARNVACGMVGVNVGVPAPMALFAFSGWNKSFYGDLHVQGMEGILFYTRQRVVFSRWDDNYVRTQGW